MGVGGQKTYPFLIRDMKHLTTFLFCLMCWMGAKAAPPVYTFSRGGDCNLKIERGSQLTNSMNLQDLTWREPKFRDQIEVRDYSTSFSLRNEQIANYAADQVDSLIAQLTIWKDSCLLEGGGATDLNFAQNSLTFDGNRTHDLNSNTLTINGTGTLDLNPTLAGTQWVGQVYGGNNFIGLGLHGWWWRALNSVSGVDTKFGTGDLTALGRNDHTLFLAHGDGATNQFVIQAQYDTSDASTNADIFADAASSGGC